MQVIIILTRSWRDMSFTCTHSYITTTWDARPYTILCHFSLLHTQSTRRIAVHLTNKQRTEQKRKKKRFSTVRYWSVVSDQHFISYIEAIINSRFLFNFVVNWFLNVFILFFGLQFQCELWSDQLITFILLALKQSTGAHQSAFTQSQFQLNDFSRHWPSVNSRCFLISLVSWFVIARFKRRKKTN